MVKRVSLKGKGAEIFFGDATTRGQPPQEPRGAERSDGTGGTDLNPATPPAPPAPQPKSKDARLRASMQESKHARTADVTAGGTAASAPAARSLDVLDAIYDHVAARATVTNAFRYTERDLTLLTDALYQLSKRHGTKLSKQDVARLGLNVVLWDYQTRGDDSLLTQLALRRKREHGGDAEP